MAKRKQPKRTRAQKMIRRSALLAVVGFFWAYSLTGERIVRGKNLYISPLAVTLAVIGALLLPALTLAVRTWKRRSGRIVSFEVNESELRKVGANDWVGSDQAFWDELEDFPKRPSVYRLWNDSELAPVYIGQAVDAQRRIRQHAGRSREHQIKAWWPEIRYIEITTYRSKRAMAKAETEAIESEHPRENYQHNAGGYRRQQRKTRTARA